MAVYTLKNNHTAEMKIIWAGEEWKKALVMADDIALRDNKSRDEALEELINNKLDELYPAALEELKLEPLSEVETEISDFAPDSIEFTFTFEVAPHIQIGDLSDLHYEAEVKEVTDADINAVILELRDQAGVYHCVENTPAQPGDEVIIDYAGETDGKEFEGGKAENTSLMLGSGTFIEGFEEQLIGCVSGEEKDIHVTFPKVYHTPNLAGKDAVFHVTLHEVRRLEPGDDDAVLEAAAEVYGEVADMDELKEAIADDLAYENEEAAAEEAGDHILEELMKRYPFDIPERLIVEETTNVYEEYLSQLQDQGIDPEDYLKENNRTDIDIRKACRNEAEMQVRKRMLLTAIADKFNLEPAEDEIEAEYEEMAEAMGVTTDVIKDAADESMVVESLRLGMAMDYLKTLCE